MRTFAEACEATIMQRFKLGQIPKQAPDELQEAADRFASMHQEIQGSEEAAVLAMFLMDMGATMGYPMQALLAVAFSHGVVVGMMMERQEEL